MTDRWCEISFESLKDSSKSSRRECISFLLHVWMYTYLNLNLFKCNLASRWASQKYSLSSHTNKLNFRLLHNVQLLICFWIDWSVYLCLTTDIHSKSSQTRWIEINFGIGKYCTLKWEVLRYCLILMLNPCIRKQEGV